MIIRNSFYQPEIVKHVSLCGSNWLRIGPSHEYKMSFAHIWPRLYLLFNVATLMLLHLLKKRKENIPIYFKAQE